MRIATFLLLSAGCACLGNAQSIPKAGTDFTSITNNGAWTWYGNPDAVYYEGKFKKTYMGWISNTGVISVASYDHTTGDTATKVVRTGYQIDDHNHPSLLVRPDGRLMVFFSGHDGPTLSLYVSINPEDISSFGPEIQVAPGPGITYAYPNPMFLSAEGDSGRIYVFYRSMGLKPCFTYSDDWGKTWTPTKNYYTNPDSTPKSYVNYCCNGKDEIDMVIEKGHRAGYWPLYYLKYKQGAFYKANGTQLATMDHLPIINTLLDTVMDPAASGCHGSAWDISLDNSGLPVAVYDQFKDANNHIYYYIRWTGSSWFKKLLVNSGATMGAEDGFAGGITLDHDNTGNIYMSRQINGMHEIDRWTTSDAGETWDSTAITRGSAKKNTRPIVPRNHKEFDKLDVIWMYGDYTAFTGTGFNTAVKMYPFSETVGVKSVVNQLRSPLYSFLQVRADGISFRLEDPARSSLKIFQTNGALRADMSTSLRSMAAGNIYVPFSDMSLVSGIYEIILSSGANQTVRKVAVCRR